MARYQIVLPDIDYRTVQTFGFPELTNSLSNYPNVQKFARWGSLSRSQQGQFPFHGFVDDWRIEAIWRDKLKGLEKVALTKIAVAPDYTVELDDPLPYAFYQVWRSRVVARYWQDCGVYSIPALQWSRYEINKHLFQGLKNCEVVAVRSPTKGTLENWTQCAQQFLKINQPKLVLHFGTKSGIDVWHNAIQMTLF